MSERIMIKGEEYEIVGIPAGCWHATDATITHFAYLRKTTRDGYRELFKEGIRVRPLQDRLIVQPLEGETKTASGLYIPDKAQEKPHQGKVIAVGPGRKNSDGTIRPMEVMKGDTILFGRFAGTHQEINGMEYLIIREEDVLAVMERS